MATINSSQKTKIVLTITKKRKDNTKHEYLKHVCLNFKKAPWSTNITIVFETLAITNGHLGIIKFNHAFLHTVDLYGWYYTM